jgi:steroid 5-alpha reductase family enzyme
MTRLVSDLGFNPASSTSVFLLLAIYTFAVVTIIWAIGLFQSSHSMMDAYYGFGYAIPVLLAYAIVHPRSATAAVLVVMACLHGCRLGWYLAARWRRYVPVHGGDPRYLNFVKELSPGYWWKSFFRVMEPQAVIIVLIGSPAVVGVLENRGGGHPLGWLAFLGIAVFGVGLYFESLADGQLQAFLALDKRPRYLNSGVWKHSRHPNYFGTTTVWWGMWLVAVSANSHIWWTVIGPAINTLMLTSVLGSKFQDDYMGSRPEYRTLMAHTRRFLPLPLSPEKIAANEARIAAANAAAAAAADATTDRAEATPAVAD